MGRNWTIEEEQFLIDNVKNMTVHEMAIALNKTDGMIRGKKERMNLIRKNNQPYMTELELQTIKEWYDRHGDNLYLEELSKIMNRTVSLICRKAREMGLTKIGRNSLLRIENSRNELINYYNTDAGKQTKLQISLSLKELFKDKNNHPRGMLGKHQDEEFRKDRSLYAKEYWYNITPEQLQHRLNKYRQTRINNYTNNKNKLTKQNNPYSRCHGGKRSDIGDIYFRSSWEANFARICNYENIQWKYESQKFIFENVDDGILSYTPDFYLLEYDKIIEIKGWMNKQSVLRLEKFKKYYPNEYNKLIIITEKEYKLLKTRYKNMIENFE